MRLLGRINITFIIALLGLIFMASPAIAQDCDFDNWDANNDSFWDDNEFFEAYGEVDYYSDWDDDDNDSLSESEWEMGIDEHLSAYDAGKFDNWDTNGDGNISESELQNGLFELIDQDNDGLISEDDWGIFNENGIFC